MALFSSAFESSAGAGPSFTPPSKGASGQKRKRTSLGPDGNVNKDGQLRSTQANLQKLMKGLEGETKTKTKTPRDGGESMGSIKMKKKPKQVDHDRYEEDSPARPANAKGKKPMKNQSKPHDSPAGSKEKAPKQDKDVGKKARTSTGGSGSKVEPAELSLPHNIRPHESSETEGLTKMQRDMKSKLEGARFRSAPSGMVSLRACADCQVDQRTTVLYTFD